MKWNGRSPFVNRMHESKSECGATMKLKTEASQLSGLFYEPVSTGSLTGLVECALIVAAKSLMG
jgi:hypothetical protein